MFFHPSYIKTSVSCQPCICQHLCRIVDHLFSVIPNKLIIYKKLEKWSPNGIKIIFGLKTSGTGFVEFLNDLVKNCIVFFSKVDQL